jgi:hypothetical protein
MYDGEAARIDRAREQASEDLLAKVQKARKLFEADKISEETLEAYIGALRDFNEFVITGKLPDHIRAGR